MTEANKAQENIADDKELWIVTETEVVEESVEVDGRRSGGDRGGGFELPRQVFEAERTVRSKRTPVSANKVKTQMQDMISIVNDLFDDANAQKGLQLNEVELSVEISAEGKVSLIGNGGTLASKGGITLKFVRPGK